MKTRTMTRTQAELLLAAVIIARSTSYVLTKVGLQDMGKFTLLAVRFLLAFAFLAALFRRLLQIDRRTLLSGLAMGGIYFCVMTAELTALKTVETSTVSFVTNTAVVIVVGRSKSKFPRCLENKNRNREDCPPSKRMRRG